MASGAPVTSTATAPQKQVPVCLSVISSIPDEVACRSAPCRRDVSWTPGPARSRAFPGAAGESSRSRIAASNAASTVAFSCSAQPTKVPPSSVLSRSSAARSGDDAGAQFARRQPLLEHAREPLEMEPEELVDRARACWRAGPCARRKAHRRAAACPARSRRGTAGHSRAGGRPGLACALPDRLERRDEALEILLHQDGDQVLLGREVVVHAGLGDAGASGRDRRS